MKNTGKSEELLVERIKKELSEKIGKFEKKKKKHTTPVL